MDLRSPLLDGRHGVNLHDLLPVPYTEEALGHVVDRVNYVQDFLGRRLTIENVSSYVTFAQSEMTEWEFVSELARRTGCWLLFDVNNVYVSAFNHGFSTLDFLHAMPRDNVVQFHVAGHSDEDSHIIDTHDHPVCDEVWDLYRDAIAYFGAVSTMIERDDNIPLLPSWSRNSTERGELPTRCSAPRCSAPRCSTPLALRRRNEKPQGDSQDEFQRGILAGDDAILGEVNDSSKEERRVLFGVYRNAYVARLAGTSARTTSRSMPISAIAPSPIW